jgi:hypothetical protein
MVGFFLKMGYESLGRWHSASFELTLGGGIDPALPSKNSIDPDENSPSRRRRDRHTSPTTMHSLLRGQAIRNTVSIPT